MSPETFVERADGLRCIRCGREMRVGEGNLSSFFICPELDPKGNSHYIISRRFFKNTVELNGLSSNAKIDGNLGM